MKVNKTNAARLLDKAGIKYELIPYVVDENDLSAVHVAAQLHEPIDMVFKTLVMHGDKTGIPMKDLLSVAGYIRGACSPVGMKKLYPTYIHETALDYPYIYVSAGQRGLQLKVSPAELVKEVKATVCKLF